MAKQSRENIAAQKRVDDLIAALAQARAAPAHTPAADPGAIAAAGVAARAEKVSKLGIALGKSYKVKEFKDNNEV